MKTGVLGGTFDPVHLGHLAVAKEARLRLGLSRLIFMPAGQPYFKDVGAVTPAEHRLKMLQLAAGRSRYYEISRLEIDRAGPSFAVDTLALLKEALDPQDELYFILGWDSLMYLPTWKEPRRLISLCRLAAAPRPGYPTPDIALLEKDLPGITSRTVVMDRPLVDISSTMIRQRVREGLSIDRLVPPAVAAYISEHGLYRG
jgi:nicotinate-nucleotide adenylyltransferase